jgi:hypothetical protein
MKPGFLSQYVAGIALKRLSAVEADTQASHQHEFNGVGSLKQILGADKHRFPATFAYLADEEERSVTARGMVTWYDAREQHLTRSEYRLYFPTTVVSERAAEDDLLLVAKKPDASLLILIAQSGSTAENQVLWLFQGIGVSHGAFAVRDLSTGGDRPLDFSTRLILEELGLELRDVEVSKLDVMLKRFDGSFPTTDVFSQFAREDLLGQQAVVDDPDAALVNWMAHEEKLFRTLERHLVSERLKTGFGTDVDIFIDFSLSVQNRRKARAGRALENHLEEILKRGGVRYSRGRVTENRNTPDFMFPGIVEYRDASFPTNRLSMLGVKSTCKDRWRQVLAEAERIAEKHLLTLEPGISQNQTSEMQAHRLRLVVPASLHPTFDNAQQSWLMSVRDFIALVKSRQ